MINEVIGEFPLPSLIYLKHIKKPQSFENVLKIIFIIQNNLSLKT